MFQVFICFPGTKIFKNNLRKALIPHILLFGFLIVTIISFLLLMYVDISILNSLFANREVR